MALVRTTQDFRRDGFAYGWTAFKKALTSHLAI
jgi:hypothetical protein